MIRPVPITHEILRQRLKLKHLEAKNSLFEKHPHVVSFLKNKNLDLGLIREHSAKLLSAGALTGSLLLSPPIFISSIPMFKQEIQKISNKDFLAEVSKIVPEKVRPLTREEEKYLEKIILLKTGIPVRGTLEGEHLNTTYGLIGAEQHLRRYPGDKLSNHIEDRGNLQYKSLISGAGMAPGLGAWGYFASSKANLTADLVETERWYAVVQTLYLPDWEKRLQYLRDWYKYRKVLILNTKNGNSVVAAIADSGPGAFTGKHFGASPEVMYYLGGPKFKKGEVLFFFVDDPDNKIPIGLVEYNKI